MLQPGQRVCRCAECSVYLINSGAGGINGRIVSKRTYASHQKASSKERPFDSRSGTDASPNVATEEQIHVLASELKSRSQHLPLTSGLVFATPPTVDTNVPEIPMMDPNDLEFRRLSLTSGEPVNEPFLEYESWLLVTRNELLQRIYGESEYRRLSVEFEEEFQILQRHKVVEWRRQQEDLKLRKWAKQLVNRTARPMASPSVETTALFGAGKLNIEPLTLACYALTAVLHLMCGLSLDDCRFFLPCIEMIVYMSSPGSTERRLEGFPRDPRTVLTALKLKPDVQAFACCQKCFALYASDGEVPDLCSFKETTTSKPCCEPLFCVKRVGDKTQNVFVREYFHQILKIWLGKLLCRPGVEGLLDRDVFAGSSGDFGADIFSGDVLRHFSASDGSTFLPSRPSEGRYIFGLSVDAFNPFLNKQAGKKASTTAVYMVLLNLPPSVRYKVENMYLAGVVPGPREPSLTQINHLLRPLINELLEFWDPGVWYTRTPSCASGKLVRAALVPLICDLKAARQVMGHGSHSAKKFCSICSISWEQRNEISEASRIPVPAERFREYALEWKMARSQSERDKTFKKHGIRWSVLLDLPYWDPPRFTIVDSMHTILLGHLHRHCSIIWGMNATHGDGGRGRKANANPVKRPGSQAVISAAWTIRSGTASDVVSLKTNLLRDFCLENGLLPLNSPTSFGPLEIQDKVLKYRVEQGWFSQSDQEQPKNAPDFLSKVYSVPKSIIRDVELRFKDGLTPNETMRALGSTRRVVLSALYAEVLRRSDPPPTHIEVLVKATEVHSVKRLDIVKTILELRQTRGREGCGWYDQPPTSTPETADEEAVLSKETLSEIWMDMKRTVLPSRISPVPRGVGSPTSGKLTADQWRTFCTIHLVISLIRLWGNERPDTRLSQILINFLHLVSLTNLLHMRKITSECIENIGKENLVYLQGLRTLYPEFSLVPKHHMALHFPEMLRDFGPVHSWRTFAFERLNQIFQNVLTNGISGQLEHTILNRFCMMQSLHGLMPLLSDDSQQLIQAFNRRFKYGRVGTLMSDMSAAETAEPIHTNPSPKDLDQEAIDLLREWKRTQPGYSKLSDPRQASNLRKYDHSGDELKPKRVAFGNSLVIVGDRTHWRAAQIEALFDITLYPSGVEKHHILAKVVYFPELSVEDALHDPYRRFSNAGRVFYTQDEDSGKAVLSVDDIMCHFAMTPSICGAITKGHIHALPLIQVTFSSSHATT